MAFLASLIVFAAISRTIFAANEVVITSSEKSNPDQVDTNFGEVEPVKITEVRREPAVIEEGKEKRDNFPQITPENANPPAMKVHRKPEGEQNSAKNLSDVPLPIEVPPMENKEKSELPASIQVEKRRSERRQHRPRKPPTPGGNADKDGIEDSKK